MEFRESVINDLCLWLAFRFDLDRENTMGSGWLTVHAGLGDVTIGAAFEQNIYGLGIVGAYFLGEMLYIDTFFEILSELKVS